jgi:beta-carotene isomerase
LSDDLIQDCNLANTTYTESPLDIILLGIFRGLVQKEISFKSEVSGIRGLLEEGKHYYMSEAGAVTENQHAFVRRTLGALLTPFLPPFYRIFMAGERLGLEVRVKG